MANKLIMVISDYVFDRFNVESNYSFGRRVRRLPGVK